MGREKKAGRKSAAEGARDRKPTRTGIDALIAKGMTVKQVAEVYQCSEFKIARLKGRKPQGWRADKEYRNPIREGEIAEAKKVSIGTPIMVFNQWKKNKRDDFSWGVWEESRVAMKFGHIALLENGMSVDYAEIAMQMREKRLAKEEAGGGGGDADAEDDESKAG